MSKPKRLSPLHHVQSPARRAQPRTLDQINEFRPADGEWTVGALKNLGVPWPPPMDWVAAITAPRGDEIFWADWHGRKPCECGAAISPGDLIVKRNGRWVHVACCGVPGDDFIHHNADECCVHGHPWTPENTRYTTGRAPRRCRICEQRQALARQLRKVAVA